MVEHAEKVSDLLRRIANGARFGLQRGFQFLVGCDFFRDWMEYAHG